MGTVALRAEGLAKRYRIGQREPYLALRDVLVRRARSLVGQGRATHPGSLSEHIWALHDVSFEIEAGTAVGIIGANGAGKSTLLKILARITRPTEGRAEIHGRVGSLLEVGTGFHPELTGRENVYMSGAILGMSKREIELKFDDIVEFADIRRFIDTPVKHYSSGMYVRLAFAVAAHLEPEILLVDEVLAVGDLAFQRKCLGRMEAATSQGRTVVFVSHNLAAVENLCDYGVLLEAGRVVTIDKIARVVSSYTARVTEEPGVELRSRIDRQGDGKLRITSLLVESSGAGGMTATLGKPASIVLEYRAEELVRNVSVAVALYDHSRQCVLHLSNEVAGDWFGHAPMEARFVCDLDQFPLRPGTYTVNVYVEVNGQVADWVQDAARIDVLGGDFYGTGKLPPPGHGTVMVPHRWAIRP